MKPSTYRSFLSTERHGVFLVTLIVRGLTLGSRFALSLFIAKVFGLRLLGEWGLISGVVAVAPTICGFGLVNAVLRTIAAGDMAAAVDGLFRAWTLAMVVYAASILVILALLPLLSGLTPLLVCAILLSASEQIATDCSSYFFSIERPQLANVLTFMRVGLPCFIIMGVTYFFVWSRTTIVLVITFAIANCLVVLFALPMLRNVRRRRRPKISQAAIRGDIRRAVPLYLNDAINTLGLYLDRFIISTFVGLELAGVYVLFWSIGNAMFSVVSTGVILARRTQIIRVVLQSPTRLEPCIRRLIRDCAGYGIALSTICILSVTPILLTLHRPQISSNLVALLLILLGFVCRMAFDGAGMAFFVRGQDRLSVASAAATALAAACLQMMLIPTLGLTGAAVAFVSAYAFGLAARLKLFPISRRLGVSSALYSARV